MGFNCGIVGLPNVGKSDIFNALTATSAAQAANYPFCTIEPNVGRVGVPDDRLDKLAAVARFTKNYSDAAGSSDIWAWCAARPKRRRFRQQVPRPHPRS